MDRMLIRPRDGLVLRTPEGGVLPAEGMEVERSLFWLRRLADGDVVEVTAQPRAKKGAEA